MQTQFASREELLAYVTEFSLAQGFAIVIHKSNVPRGQLWLRCDLGGSAREEPQPASLPSTETSETDSVAAAPKRKRKRKTKQRHQSCPFQLYGRRLADGMWTLKVQNDQHTHPLASRKQDLVTHPKARRLSNGQKRLVMQLTDMGIRPAVIVERMKARFPDKPIKVQDIYNARNHIRLERLAGREPFPEARESDDNTSQEAGQDGTEALPSVAPGEHLRSHQESGELQQLWASVEDIVPRWPGHVQTSFVHGIHALLARLSRENTVPHTHTQTQESTLADSEPAEGLNAAGVEPCVEAPVNEEDGMRS